jgi:hypothetical protein
VYYYSYQNNNKTKRREEATTIIGFLPVVLFVVNDINIINRFFSFNKVKFSLFKSKARYHLSEDTSNEEKVRMTLIHNKNKKQTNTDLFHQTK